MVFLVSFVFWDKYVVLNIDFLNMIFIFEKGRFLIEEECILGYIRICYFEIWFFIVEVVRGF